MDGLLEPFNLHHGSNLYVLTDRLLNRAEFGLENQIDFQIDYELLITQNLRFFYIEGIDGRALNLMIFL